jgi:hypothetical protein
MVKTKTTERGRTPPYAPWAQVKNFLDAMKALNPKVIDLDYLKKNQMGGEGPSPLLATVRFLGLVDGQGNCTAKLDSIKVRGLQEYQQALQSIVRDAYAMLFNAVDVEQADAKLIFNQMRSVYGCSRRVATAAAPLFLSLCREAGITTAQQLRKPAAKTITPKKERTVKAESRQPVAPQQVVYSFNISVTPEMTEEQILDQMHKAQSAIRRLEQE